MAFFRTATNLLEKIVAINERAIGLRQLADFQATIIEVLDHEVPAGDRTRIIELLRSKIGTEARPVDVPEAE